jgi:predicted dehydrogenase
MRRIHGIDKRPLKFYDRQNYTENAMKQPFQISRRSFLHKSAIVAAASGLPLWYLEREAEAQDAAAQPPGPNDRPGIALIGCGGQGQGDAGNASRFGDIVAVCDVDEHHASSAARKFSKDGKTPDKYSDFRKLLERNDIHAIVQATPDHWHTLINIAAAKAKKDVYGEKPLTLTIAEGRHVINAVRDNKIVFQTGTQQRSSKSFRLACELVRNNRLGKLQEVHVFVPAGIRGGPFQKVPVPEGFDYQFWLGQAPEAEYFTERCFANFRWWYDYSGGPITDWGAHHNDIARWAIGLDGPVAVEGKITVPALPDGYTTPGEYEATLTWANGVKQYVRTTPDDSPYGAVINENGQRNGVKFIGPDGWIWVNRDGISASDKELLKTPLPDSATRLVVSNDHMRNFFDSVGSRKDPVAPVEAGHRSACVGHLIIIALRTGLKLTWDPDQELFTGEGADAGNAMRERPMRAPYNYDFAG